jgi:L-fuculose-phosphate aldolase
MWPRDSRHLRRQIVAACHFLSDRRLVAARDGNVSVRVSSKTGGLRFVITPSGFALRSVRPVDLVTVDADGRVARGRRPPSSEWRLHARLYEASESIGAVVHAHPETATAFAVAGRALDMPVLPEVAGIYGGIALLPYATPSTDAVGQLAAGAARDGFSLMLLQNHGAATVAADVVEAAYRMEKIEQAARIFHAAESLGGAIPLPEGETERIRKLYG